MGTGYAPHPMPMRTPMPMQILRAVLLLQTREAQHSDRLQQRCKKNYPAPSAHSHSFARGRSSPCSSQRPVGQLHPAGYSLMPPDRLYLIGCHSHALSNTLQGAALTVSMLPVLAGGGCSALAVRRLHTMRAHLSESAGRSGCRVHSRTMSNARGPAQL